uniref:Sushi domain containing 5 n=1 Tax=Gasterosteus aculeatus aculeatus TaxID=481459 RepID=A0AAQ4PBV5_GASAC
MLGGFKSTVLLFACLTCLVGTSVVNADGRVFVLDLRNSSGLQGFRDAEGACASRHARLASAQELHHAVAECFFSSCARGWLYGGTVGTTVCDVVGNARKAVDVRTENATKDAAHLDAFCIKDRGVPCGDPPSFPNVRLQGHSGYEMGDELLYTCVPGYAMPSGHSAFSLLCDSCGEWYGRVEICVKAAHQEEGRSLEQQETSFSVKVEQKHQDQHGKRGVGAEVIGQPSEGALEEAEEDESRVVEDFVARPRGEQEVVETNGATVSSLSQKHLFWFPPEAFQEEGHPVSDDIDSRQHVISSIAADERQNGTQKRARGEAATDDTWLDGHPVVQEGKEMGDSTTEGLRLADAERGTIVRATDRPNEVEIRGPGHSTSPPQVAKSSTTTTPSNQEGADEPWHGFTLDAAPSQPWDSPSSSDSLDYDTQQAAPTHFWQGDLTEHPFLDPGPVPPMRDGNGVVTGEDRVHNLPGEAGERGEMEGEAGEAICTGDNCPPHPPSSSSRGPTVAAIIVALCAVATAVVVGVWCYRRQQQKSSMYEMNGKGQSQNRQGQHIEMQQKV